MNVSQLRRQIGTLLRLRPLPRRLTSDGTPLPPIDDRWRLDAILDSPARLSLVSQRTGHVLVLQPDNVKEFRSPDFLLLRCRLTISPRGIDIEPLIFDPGRPLSAVEPESIAPSYVGPRFSIEVRRWHAGPAPGGGYAVEFAEITLTNRSDADAVVNVGHRVSVNGVVYYSGNEHRLKVAKKDFATLRDARFEMGPGSVAQAGGSRAIADGRHFLRLRDTVTNREEKHFI